MAKKNQASVKTAKVIPPHLEKKLYADGVLTIDEYIQLSEILVNKNLAVLIRAKIETGEIKIPDTFVAPPDWLHSMQCLLFSEDSRRWIDNEFEIRSPKVYFESEKMILRMNLYNVLHTAVRNTSFTIIG